MRLMSAAMVALMLLPVAARADDTPDPAVLARIIDAGMNHGEVVDTVAYLTDRIGGRMTNSPAMRAAEAWTQGRFRQWGLANVHLEPFEFGRGWSIDHVAVRMVTPRVLPLTAIPVAWTPGTGAAIAAPIVVAVIKRERDFATWRGKLAGKIVLVSLPGESDEPKEPAFQRMTGEEIAKLDKYEPQITDSGRVERNLRRADFGRQLDAFLATEGARAWVSKSYRDGGLVSGEGSGYRVADQRKVPGIQMAAEDYRRLARLAKGSEPVTLEIDTRITFHAQDTRANNVIAEISGRDPKAGYVMAGAHLDSWVAADGATDNAAGSAVVMEAARILAGLGIAPKRAIRFALWSGEEQGLLGSLAYIDRHLAARPADPGPTPPFNAERGWQYRYPITPKPGFGELAAYFNLDNGSGKIRGIYTEGNPALAPIFRSWLAPFASMGASAVVASRTGGTDHVYLQTIGIPGFQFIQDPLDYDSRTHHSDVDTFDHLRPADLRQAAVIMASFLWNAANRAEPLPRPPLPTQPKESDPFGYVDPDDMP